VIERAVLGAIDPGADPCADFYQYACGGWLARVPPPTDRPQVMRSFTSIEARNQALLVAVLERGGPGAAQRRAQAFFDSCMDVAAVEATGLRPLEPVLREIDGVSDLQDLFRVAARMTGIPGASPLLTLGLERDPHDPARLTLLLAPGGYGLPDPTFYLDEAKSGLVDDYRSHVARMLELAGAREARARARARAVVDLERKLARAARSAGETAPAPVLGRAALRAIDPSLPWDEFFAALGARDLDAVDVPNPEFIRGLGEAVRAAEAETLVAYLRWHLLNALAERLGRAFDEEDFVLEAKLTGQSVMPPRPERCAQATLASLPDLTSEAWVEAAFTGESQAMANAMLAGIAAVFEASLPANAWMDPVTRVAAKAKSARMLRYVGHPDPWPPEPGFEVHPERYLENTLAAGAAHLAAELAAAGRPADPATWPIPAIAMRGFYDARAHAIVLPAGLLQPPLFEPSQPRALRWGSSGPIMAHEFLHAFDAQGALFDSSGNVAPWWSDAARSGYEEAAACLVDYYGRYEVAPGLRLDGERTLAENVADVGGLALAHRAWRAEAGAEAAERSPIGELSNEQLFFVGSAQIWCASSQPGYDAAMARSDARARPRQRANGPLAQLPAFRDAFSCQPGAAMAPEPICRVW
jgi:predicted metalloendopeptidase